MDNERQRHDLTAMTILILSFKGGSFLCEGEKLCLLERFDVHD